jgi:cardiolipin synthase C
MAAPRDGLGGADASASAMLDMTRVPAIAALVLAAAMLCAGCAGLPPLEGREPSTALTDTADTRLGRALQDAVVAHPGLSGIYGLERPQDAFVARVVLARGADRSLDVQYYIWHGDTTGHLLLEELWKAAERGVRVRLLVDDNGVAGLDRSLSAMDSHPRIEVRLFNPFVNRRLRVLGYVTDFSRLNRRMHNKSMTADSQATIVGGRNIGDEYFGAGQHLQFADLDVLAAGPVAGEVAAAFDLYWNSDSAYPAASIIGATRPDDVSALQAMFAEVRSSPAATGYLEALQETRMMQQLEAGQLPMHWVPVKVIYDEPTKILAKAQQSELLMSRLMDAVGQAQHELDLISPYFVPGERGTEALAAYPKRGVRLRIITNSLAATDVGAVHAGYAKRREPLLRAGARIYELKPDFVDRSKAQEKAKKGTGSSSASLHTKTFSLDRSRVFVGSFNLDPRSVNLNTEMGVVIESDELAGAVSGYLDQEAQRRAYEVRLVQNGRGLEWVERTEQGEVRYDREPKTGWLKRLGIRIMSWLPIEWML